MAQAEAEAERLRKLRSKRADLERDIADLEARRDKLAALKDRHVEIPETVQDHRYRVKLALEPRRSVLTGRQLAAQVEVSIEPLHAELERTQDEIAALAARN